MTYLTYRPAMAVLESYFAYLNAVEYVSGVL